MSLLFGADPEFFCAYKDDEGYDYVISPALLEKDLGIKPIGGDIKHPVYIETPEFRWMMDGVAFEITILQPYGNLLEVWKTVRNGLDCLNNFISKLNHPVLGELHLNSKPAININPELYIPYLNDERIYQGFIFGCDRDYDAVDLEYDCKTQDVATCMYRYGGGHEHISNSPLFKDFPKPAIRLMACTVGNFVTKTTKLPDLEKLRISTYGRPFRFRPQFYKNNIYGVEYRTPSNSWISFKESEIEEMDFWSRKAVELLENQEKGKEVLNNLLETTTEAIVTVNQELATKNLSNIL